MEPGRATLEEAIGFTASQERVTKAFADLITGDAGLDEEAELVIAADAVFVHDGGVDHNADGVPVRLYGVVQEQRGATSRSSSGRARSVFSTP